MYIHIHMCVCVRACIISPASMGRIIEMYPRTEARDDDPGIRGATLQAIAIVTIVIGHHHPTTLTTKNI